MKIGLRYGHSINCRGARGKIDEVDSCRILYGKIKALLEVQGHTVIDCNSNANNVNSELSEGTNKANNAKVDIYITIHMNSFNGKAKGVECWVYDTNSKTAITIGNKICANISKLGTPNREVKYSTGYHDLNASSMESIIVESLFCDNSQDAELFNKKTDELARAIANGIDGRVSLNISKPQKPINKEEYDMKKIVTYLGDADLFAAVMVAQKLSCPLMRVNDFKASGLKAKEVIQIGGNVNDTNRFSTMKNAANKYL
ncbi:N-acetylmuramoyl-L-alanine amidase [Clostridium sp. UBA3887]|uniref:N-acetylmuramoyl-L-alanine amidase n=1 Tax=Clostridium sp. UBA3887 TaxID=1946356 RepID=UPI0032169B8F